MESKARKGFLIDLDGLPIDAYRMAKTLLIRSPSARQIHAARVALDWNQQDLAKAAGVGIATIKRIEFNHRDEDLLATARHETLRRIVAVLEENGIEFSFEEGREGVSFRATPEKASDS